MNLKEGTRRLALLLGLAGAIVGGFASYMGLQDVLSQRTRHNKFEQLMASDVVQRQSKFLQKSADFIPGPYPMDKKQFAQKIKARFPEYKDIDDETLVVIILEKYPQYRDMVKVDPWEKYAVKEKSGTAIDPKTRERIQTPPDFIPDDPYPAIALPNPSDVNKGGIKTINWTHGYGVESIVTEDGQTLYPTQAPAAWQYLFIVLVPILGFCIPWGAVRAIGWVGAGFVQSAK
jgi:hypothetical protein